MVRSRQGFTLVELIVVIAIIAILVAILSPALMGALRWAKEAVCASRLETIGKGMVSYSSTNDESFPVAPALLFTGTGNKNNWQGTVIGATRGTVSGDTAQNVTITRSLWLLVIGGQVPVQAFICPATESEPDVYGANTYDFTSGDYINYSYQVPYGKPLVHLGSTNGMALLADRSPWFDNTNGSYDATDIGVPVASNTGQNSYNHDQRGQNVMYPDAHVEWAPTPNAGVDGDHIYAYSGGNTTSNAGSITGQYCTLSDKDSYLGQ